MTNIITEANLEFAMDRPSDTPWTAEENARYAAGRAATVARAIARAKARINDPFVLTDGGSRFSGGRWIAEFDVRGDSVTITHTNLSNPASVRDPETETVSRAAARERWARLIDAGYWQE